MSEGDASGHHRRSPAPRSARGQVFTPLSGLPANATSARDRPAEVPPTLRRHTPGCRGRCRQIMRGSQHSSEVNRPKLLAATHRPLDRQPTWPWRDEGAANPRGLPASRERRRRKGLAFGRVRAGGFRRPGAGSSKRIAAIRLPVVAVHSPTCGPRPRGAPLSRHGAAWRASLPCCEQSPSCRASCRRRRRGCRSWQGAAR